MPGVGVGGIELYYERAGAGEPLLLVQGLTGTHLAWGERFPALLGRNFECVSFDNRGVGRSGAAEEEFSIADLAADALGLLDALEIERAHLLGISMGGMVAQELALAEADRLLSLTIGCSYCGGPGSRLMEPDDFQLLAAAWASGERERVYRAMWELNLSAAFRADEDRYPAFREMAAALPVPSRTIELQLRAISRHDTSARLPGLAVPTLVLHGDEDRVLGVGNGHRIASLVPGSRLEVFKRTGHLFWWEHPQRSAELIRSHAGAAATT